MTSSNMFKQIQTDLTSGQKRKLILTDNGDGPVIYKFKKSKLEENVKVGDML